MSKTKNKEGSELRFLQGEVRRLSKLVRSLEKENRALKKWEHSHEGPIGQDDQGIVEDSEDTFIKRGIPCKSESCGKGIYKEFELMDKLYGTCPVCNDRRRLK